ncbi:MAG: hypothetical protein MZU95_04950 [Desulfomicrobium escambiense]|nr:hypothetical protein [Desulfomicrobium escambiense]
MRRAYRTERFDDGGMTAALNTPLRVLMNPANLRNPTAIQAKERNGACGPQPSEEIEVEDK